MSDLSSSNWSEQASANTAIAPNGLKDGESPNKLAGTIREHWAAEKRFYNQINAIYTSTGSANAYVLTFVQAPEALVKGSKFAFIPNFTSTGAATLNINGIGAKVIVASDGSALASGAIVTGQSVVVRYDGTSFYLETGSNSPVFSGTVKAGTVTGTFSGSGASLTALNASNLATGTLPAARLVGNYSFTGLTLSGGATLSGASFGSAAVTSPTDLGRHLALYGTTFGFSITSNTLNLVSSSAHDFYNSGTKTLSLTPSGITFLGNKVFHAGNDGAGSGLDADTLDTYQAANLYRHNADHATSGNLTITNTAPIIQLVESDTAKKWFLVADGSAFSLRENDTGQIRLSVAANGSATGFTYLGNKVFHAGNDGAGSGLDADVLDGQQGSFYQARANHTGAQAISTITNLQASLDGKLSLAGGTMNGAITASFANPFYRYTYPGVRSLYTQVQSNGSWRLVDESGSQQLLLVDLGGNLYSPSWGNIGLTTYIENRATDRAIAWANDRVANLQYRKVSQGSSGSDNLWVAPAGAVVTGYQRETGNTGQVYNLYFMYLQIYDPVRGWVGFGG